jgi:predicted dehydrogenase
MLAAPVVFKLVSGGGSRLKAAGPNDQITLGFIGTGIRGTQLLEQFTRIPGVRVTAACDVYDGHLERAKETVPNELATTRDYHSVLARSDVDAVVIATPDHWHRQMTLDALAAEKHVYIEKPLTWSIEQGKDIIAATKKSGKLLQVGSGAKTSALTAKAREIVKSGALGKVNMVRMENNRNSPEGAWAYPVPPDASPETIDWARFLGPAPKRPFDAAVFFRWRCWWDYSGGVATDLFVHLLSQMHEIMDVKMPKSVVSQGGIFRWDDGRNVPDYMESVYEYGEGFLASMYVNLGSAKALSGTVIAGSEGALMLGARSAQGSRMVLYPEPVPSSVQRYGSIAWPKAMREAYLASEVPGSRKPEREIPVERGSSHYEHFVLSLRSGTPSKETAEEGHFAAAAAHMANTAYRKGRRVLWDGKV